MTQMRNISKDCTFECLLGLEREEGEEKMCLQEEELHLVSTMVWAASSLAREEGVGRRVIGRAGSELS